MTGPRRLILPPPYAPHLVSAGDIAAAAVARAADGGAGTLIWSFRPGGAPGRLDFAVVLEPDEALSGARRATLAGHVALAEALAAHCAPERAVRLSPQGEVVLDTSRLGGIRLVAPGTAEDAVPDWLVLAVELIADRDHIDDKGQFPASISLKEEGFEDPPVIVESFAAHLMLAFDRARHEGWAWVARRASDRLDRPGRYDETGAWVNGPARVALHALLRETPWRGTGGPIL